MTDTGFAPHSSRTDWWSRRPRRSRSDSKVAGVAGGLARHLGVDPILFRVGFVALTVVGGAGMLAYALLWLLLPAEGDEVSAGEALLGRGRSSVSPIVAALLALAVVIGLTASFSWGLPFWPALVIGVIAFHVARRRRRGPFRPGSEWERRLRATTDDVAANRWAAADQSWGGDRGGWGGGCGGHGRTTDERPEQSADSPFDTPAFWDTEAPTSTYPSGGPHPTTDPSRPTDFSRPADPFRKSDPFRKADPFGKADPFDKAGPSRTTDPADKAGPSRTTDPAGADSGTDPRVTPPAWDPLGAAPFAWDLPDIDVSPPSDVVRTRSRTTPPVIARVTRGVALLAVAIPVGGLIAGWWSPAWAVISAGALTVVAVGLLVQALRGRTLTLVGPGVFLSVATLILSITGFTGSPHFGEIKEAPTSASAVLPAYRLSAGNAELDLRRLNLASNQRVVTSLDLGAGDATVVLPAGVAYTVTCSTNAGRVDCVDQQAEGLRQTVGPVTATGSSGSIDLDVHVGAGNLTVTVAR